MFWGTMKIQTKQWLDLFDLSHQSAAVIALEMAKKQRYEDLLCFFEAFIYSAKPIQQKIEEVLSDETSESVICEISNLCKHARNHEDAVHDELMQKFKTIIESSTANILNLNIDSVFNENLLSKFEAIFSKESLFENYLYHIKWEDKWDEIQLAIEYAKSKKESDFDFDIRDCLRDTALMIGSKIESSGKKPKPEMIISYLEYCCENSEDLDIFNLCKDLIRGINMPGRKANFISNIEVLEAISNFSMKSIDSEVIFENDPHLKIIIKEEISLSSPYIIEMVNSKQLKEIFETDNEYTLNALRLLFKKTRNDNEYAEHIDRILSKLNDAGILNIDIVESQKNKILPYINIYLNADNDIDLIKPFSVIQKYGFDMLDKNSNGKNIFDLLTGHPQKETIEAFYQSINAKKVADQILETMFERSKKSP